MEFEQRRASSSGFAALMGAIFLGGLLGGGLGIQRGGFDSLVLEWRQVVESPALGGGRRSSVALDDIQAERRAQSDFDLDHDLVAPWPEGRLPSAARAVHYGALARSPMGLLGARLPQ